MSASGVADWRLRGYTLLARVLVPRRFVGKVFLLTFVGIHVPLLALAGYLLLSIGPSASLPLSVLLVTLLATLAGSAATLLGLWLLMTPVDAASAALRTYRLAGSLPALPTHLSDEAGVLMADVQHTLSYLDSLTQNLADQALRDPLTGSPNRRAFDQLLAAELAGAALLGEGVALAVVDVDGLKGVNDEFGHVVGDACLRHVVAVLTGHVAKHGWVARWGGDEFVVVVREAVGRPAIETLLMQVNAELAAVPVRRPDGGAIALRISGGVARAREKEPAQVLFDRADADLYRAKRAHRDNGRAAYRGRRSEDPPW